MRWNSLRKNSLVFFLLLNWFLEGDGGFIWNRRIIDWRETTSDACGIAMDTHAYMITKTDAC